MERSVDLHKCKTTALAGFRLAFLLGISLIFTNQEAKKRTRSGNCRRSGQASMSRTGKKWI
eukprot:4358513-Pleurochrysis_carterae.AAC.1